LDRDTEQHHQALFDSKGFCDHGLSLLVFID
jgi:hypothetical protein